MTDRDAGPVSEAADGAALESGIEPPPAVTPYKPERQADAQGPVKRKRRKRKRGRKVFAKDPSHVVSPQTGSPVTPGDARTSAAATLNPASNLPAGAKTSARTVAADANRAARAELPVFAALDLGTNNCRLLVAIPGRPGQFRVIDAFSRIVRLGEGLTSSGRLSQAAMDRAVEALKVCGEKLAVRKIRRSRLIATEACRSAENGEEFIDRVKNEAGLELEIIDRQTEARLAVSGCGPLVDRGTQGVVLFDIGGGSSEIALIDVSRHRTPRLASHIVAWTSLPVGVVSLAERFGGRDVTPEIFEDMVREVGGMLADFEAPPAEDLNGVDSGFHMIGTSGTVTTLAGVYLNLPRYDRRQVDGLWMSAEEVTAMQDRLVALDFEARAANPCIGPDRADLVLAGCAILEAIRRRFPASRMRVADRGLREGLLTEMMAADGVWRRSRPRPPFQRSK